MTWIGMGLTQRGAWSENFQDLIMHCSWKSIWFAELRGVLGPHIKVCLGNMPYIMFSRSIPDYTAAGR